jgi:hypothetical protein
MNVINRKKPTSTITAAEMERRREAVERATAHNRIEGLYSSPAAMAVYEEFIRGEIEWPAVWPRIQKILQPR